MPAGTCMVRSKPNERDPSTPLNDDYVLARLGMLRGKVAIGYRPSRGGSDSPV